MSDAARTTRSALADPILEGLARGWKVVDAAAMEGDRTLECDVAVVGSGAGGGITAEILAEAGLAVALVEEGPLASSSEFRMREREAYPRLYQESAARQTQDKAITILQGRCVGGSTTVNWTSSFRTPAATLARWREAHGLASMSEAALAPWFERVERRLAIAPWPVPPNENNDILRRGCRALGYASGAIARNVEGCWNLGYCGMGCPTNAKQSMLVTSIPAALDRGATLVHRARVLRLAFEGDRVAACEARGIASAGAAPGPHRLTLRARHFVLAAGSIGSPAILLRSAAQDPHLMLGRRTFLHPTVISAALMPNKVEGFAGAPQSVYSDHFLEGTADAPGFKLETGPTHPILAGITLPGFGRAHAEWMRELARVQVTIALVKDGFDPRSPGGRVMLRTDGTPVLDYPITPYLWNAVRRAYLAMAEIQFAAGAARVLPVHDAASAAAGWPEARAAIQSLPLRPLGPRVMTAHVMGGCAMGPDPRAAVVAESGRHHQHPNLSVHDASLFPTSVGANPQVSIYALAARLAAGLAADLRRA